MAARGPPAGYPQPLGYDPARSSAPTRESVISNTRVELPAAAYALDNGVCGTFPYRELPMFLYKLFCLVASFHISLCSSKTSITTRPVLVLQSLRYCPSILHLHGILSRSRAAGSRVFSTANYPTVAKPLIRNPLLLLKIPYHHPQHSSIYLRIRISSTLFQLKFGLI
jgi:hypothetical protein